MVNLFGYFCDSFLFVGNLGDSRVNISFFFGSSFRGFSKFVAVGAFCFFLSRGSCNVTSLIWIVV